VSICYDAECQYVMMLSVIMLSFIMLCRYAVCHYAECHHDECHYAECHFAECRYAECRGAPQTDVKNSKIWLYPGSTVVEHSTQNLKIRGSNPATDTGGLCHKTN
jgi:hypothetical protein